MRGELMLGSVAPNAPNGMYCVSRLVTIGCGSPPMPYGSSKPPAGSTISDRLPNGGAEALMLWRSAVGKSYEMPYDERRAVRPFAAHVPRPADARREIQPLLVQPGLAAAGNPRRPDREDPPAH